MVSTKDSAFAHPSTAEPTPEYVLRGVGLFEIHRDEILSSYLGGGRWLIPSGTESSKVYEVRVGTRAERNRCECTGHQRHGHCSHVVCATVARRRSAVCDACGERCWWSELSEVAEDDDLLAWLPGDRLCDGCRPEHWV
jgi:hypothetical protein